MPSDDPTIDDMRLALERASTVNPSLAAQGRKARAHMTPPESVMDPRYAAWKKNQEDAELFGIASDIALNAVPLAGPAFNVARKAAAPVARAAGDVLNARALSGQSMIPGLPSYMAPNPLAFVVKPKGGNWLPGDVENSMTRLKNATIPNYRNFPNAELPPGAEAQANALRNWVDTKLNRYIKNELATPEDPVRALAERGISHMQTADESFEVPLASVMRRRIKAGQDPMGAGTSPLAKQWDYWADRVVGNQTARDLSSLERESVFGNKPVSPETPVHYIRSSPWSDLELGHLVDELRNALDPASTLPRNLRLTPEQLGKVTVPQAVERVAKINAWREAQRVEANAARAMNPATVVHREYPTVPGTDLPNERGLRWVELRTPTSIDRSTLGAGDQKLYDALKAKGSTDEELLAHFKQTSGVNPLEDALKYEGETMGHCVGGPGYCEGVTSGQKRIYSLRDAKGQPHATIEVQPAVTPSQFYHSKNVPESLLDKISELEKSGVDFNWEQVVRDSPEYQAQVNQNIIQIKGKGNRKPNEEYLPFVQDFVQSGKWSEVGDIHNADMFKLPDNRFVTRKRFEEVIKKLSGEGEPAVTAEWLSNQIRSDPSWWNEVKAAFDEPTPVPRQYQEGGLVTPPTQAEMRAALQAATVNPRLQALATKVKARGERDLPLFQAPGELAATLLTGAVAQPVAAAFGPLMTGIPGIEGVNQAMSNMTYAPRTLPGQQAVELAGHAVEAAKIPPFVPVLGPLGALKSRPGMRQHIAQGAKDAVLQAALDAYGPQATASYVTKPLDPSKRKFIGLRDISTKPLEELKPNDLQNISAFDYLTSKILNSPMDRREFTNRTGKALSSFATRKLLPDLKLFGSKATAPSAADLEALKGYACVVDRIEDAIDEGSFVPSNWTAREIIKDVLSDPEQYDIENASPAVLKKISRLIEQHGFMQEGNAALPSSAAASLPTLPVPKDIQTAYRDTLKSLRKEGYHSDLYNNEDIASLLLEDPESFGVGEAHAPYVAKMIEQYGRSMYENPILGTASAPLSSAQETSLRSLFSPAASEAQPVRPAASPVSEHKMLQGVYRGYAGESDPAAARFYASPQRRVAEHYAQTRAAQTGQQPHMEMLMVDPFDVERSYGHAPATLASEEPMVTQAKQLLPEQIKGRTQLYKKGGAVTTDDMRYALTRIR